MAKVAAYLYRPAGKLYDFTEMVKYTEIKAKEVDVEIDEFYADGWDDIPNGLVKLRFIASIYRGLLVEIRFLLCSKWLKQVNITAVCVV